MNKVFVLVLAASISACGYHLRGGFELPKGLENIYLKGGSPKLRDQFNKTLEGSSGRLVKSPEQAGMIINVVDNDIKQRVLSLGQSGRSNEFELTYHLDYELRDANNKVLLAREPLDVRREYFNDQQDIIAKDNEEGTIRNEMYQNAVRTILNRISAMLENKPK
jgi:LPS-assembly lipoprotein